EQPRVDAVRGTDHEQRVAVGRGSRAELGGDDLTAAAAIIDHDLTFECFAELGRYQTPDDVTRSARRRGNDKPYRARRIGLVRYRLGMKRCRCQRAAR